MKKRVAVKRKTVEVKKRTTAGTENSESGENSGQDEIEKPVGKFETSDGRSDLTLIIEDKRLYVHKFMLGYSSPVFTKMFSGNFKEGTASEIPLPGKPYQAFINFLHQIYPGPPSKTHIQDDTVADMLALADEYQVGFLVDKCKEYLELKKQSAAELNLEQTMMYLYLCNKYSHHLSLWDEFLKIAVTYDYRKVQENEHFQLLPDERRTELLRLRCERLESTREMLSSEISRIGEKVEIKRVQFHIEFGHLKCTTKDGVCERCHEEKQRLAKEIQSLMDLSKQ